MVSTMVNGYTIREYSTLSNTLVHMSFLVSGHERAPWVMIVAAVAIPVLCRCTNSNDVAGPLSGLPFLLECAMEVFTFSKSWLRWPRAVRDPPGFFSSVLALDYILQELVLISVLLLFGGSFYLPMWLRPKFSEPSLLLLSYSGLFLLLNLSLAVLVQANSIDIQRLGRSVEFSYDREAQDTVGGLQWLKPEDGSRCSEVGRGNAD